MVSRGSNHASLFRPFAYVTGVRGSKRFTGSFCRQRRTPLTPHPEEHRFSDASRRAWSLSAHLLGWFDMRCFAARLAMRMNDFRKNQLDQWRREMLGRILNRAYGRRGRALSRDTANWHGSVCLTGGDDLSPQGLRVSSRQSCRGCW